MQPQTFENHARFHPPFHFFLTPVLLFHFLYRCVRLFQHPTVDNAEAVVLAVALLVMALLLRMNTLKVQDRLIRLEEQLRYARVLPPTLAEKASALPVRQVVAMRFASDEELAGLVEQVAAGSLSKPAEIKKAIRRWRGDYFRV